MVDMKRILITGSAGFIGSHLVDELIKQNYEVYGFDNHFPGWGNHYANPLCHYINGDLRNLEQVDFALTNMDFCIHLGAISHVKTCRENPKLAYDVNVGGTVNVLEACRKNNIKRIVCASSDHIYGRNPKTPIIETNPYNAANESDIYGLTKLFQLRLSQLYYKQYNLPIAITASANVFSERQNLPNVIPSFILNALENKDLIIHGDGKQSREFYHISNLCDAYIKCIETPNIDGELFNISGENELTIQKLAEKILELIPESDSKIKYIPNNEGHNIMEKMSLNINKAKQTLGYKVITSFEDGLKDTIKNFRK